MQQNQKADSGIRLAEVMAALSLATDLGMGLPLEYALCSCLLAVRLGETLGLSERDLREVYYLALLRYLGCNAETHAMAAIVGDEIAMRTDFSTIDLGQPSQVVGLVLRYIRQANEGSSLLHLARAAAQGLLALPAIMKEGSAGHCEVGQRLASRFGFGESIQKALGQAFERWDGKGVPARIKGEHIVFSVRLVALAQDVIIFHRLGGIEAAMSMAQQRKGTAYDPKLVEQFQQHAPHILAGLEEEPSWETVLALEPGAHTCLSEERLDIACRAIADFADLKSPYMLGHSSGVAELAAAAARHYGLPETDAVAVQRAGMLHDIGRTGVSAGIWGKPGPLSEKEWERVRLHAYYTERVLARPAALARLGTLAASHHERLDGSGYHRAVPASMLSPTARILAAADAYHAMTEPRPHRGALDPEVAAEQLQREVRAGRFDHDAVRAVLTVSGHRIRSARRAGVAGLSEREVEVLRLLARGHSKKQIAGLLFISEKTVSHHTQHIYTKIDVSTRAAAALFAMQHDLLADSG